MTHAISDLKATWALLFPDVAAPADRQFTLWAMLHDPKIVQDAFAQLAAKHAKLNGEMDQGFMLRYGSSIMNRLTREAKAQQAKVQ